MLALQRTEIVTVPSEAVPDDGETETHESELLAFQSRLAVKVIVPLLPSALNSMLVGLEIVSSGAFWQDRRHMMALKIMSAMLIVLLICVFVVMWSIINESASLL